MEPGRERQGGHQRPFTARTPASHSDVGGPTGSWTYGHHSGPNHEAQTSCEPLLQDPPVGRTEAGAFYVFRPEAEQVPHHVRDTESDSAGVSLTFEARRAGGITHSGC
jgi:hypothetical protein